ncbi:hypothetical protein [Rhodosalinus sp.]|uniref:hypothetical protein n=1 Tax=Rhodosalinus sp. TaxID=2047741 RepID=UPI00397A2638
MSGYGPSRGELRFRLIVSLAGLAMIVAAISTRPPSPAWIEMVGIGGVFFGGTAIWSAWQLRGRRRR